MTFRMKFHFPNASMEVRGIDKEAVDAYSSSMKYEVPFEVTQPAMPNAWQALEETTYIVNPNMVTYVETNKENH